MSNQPIAQGDDRWMIALDVDGTLVHDDGYMSAVVAAEVARVRALGHEVVIATGRSAANTIPVIRDLAIDGGEAVCSNGAVTVRIDHVHPRGFEPIEVISFDPRTVLTELIKYLPDAHFAVEELDGTYKFHKPFPAYALGDVNEETPLEDLMRNHVSRVVVLSPGQDLDEFLALVKLAGLHSVSYAIGYTAWLDISPQGVSKATALERIRENRGIKRDQVIVVGDGRNDMLMFEWAKAGGGLAYAMGQGPEEVRHAASAVTATVEDDGVARVLSGFEGILFSRALG